METVLFNGNIYTMTGEVYESIGIGKGKILQLGSNEELQASIGNNTNRIDLKGKTVIPGFIDTHVHLVGYGSALNAVNLQGMTSIESIIEKTRSFIEERKIPEGTWVYGRGWNQNLFDNQTFPTKEDLNNISSKHPIMLLRTCGHVASINSLGMKSVGVEKDTEIPGGQILKDESGELNGVFNEAALEWFKRQKNQNQSLNEIEHAILTGANELLKYGVTSIHSEESYDLGYAGDFFDVYETYQRLVKEERLPLRVYQKIALHDASAIEAFLKSDLRTGDGDAFYKIGPVKQWVDGTLGARTACLLSAYSDDASTKGLLYYSPDELYDNMKRLHLSGMQICLHTIGDGSLEMILNQFEKLLKTYPKANHRHRLVHVFVGQKSQYKRIARLGLNINTQSVGLSSDMDMICDRLGEERAKEAYAWRSILDAGVSLNGGSDIPVETPDVFKGIYTFVERRNVDDFNKGIFNEAEQISVEEALKIYTINGAYASFEEDIKGTLEEGKLADLVILSDNPYKVDNETLKNINVEMTIVNGKIVYKKGC